MKEEKQIVSMYVDNNSGHLDDLQDLLNLLQLYLQIIKNFNS